MENVCASPRSHTFALRLTGGWRRWTATWPSSQKLHGNCARRATHSGKRTSLTAFVLDGVCICPVHVWAGFSWVQCTFGVVRSARKFDAYFIVLCVSSATPDAMLEVLLRPRQSSAGAQPFSRCAQHAARGGKGSVSWLLTVLRDAVYFAKTAEAPAVTPQHVQKARVRAPGALQYKSNCGVNDTRCGRVDFPCRRVS